MQTAYYGGNHAGQAFLSREIPGHDQDQDCDRDRSDRQSKFNILNINDDHHELHGKSKEEEEVEFEQGDIDLETSQQAVRLISKLFLVPGMLGNAFSSSNRH